jgi:hypothetical protein
VRSVRRTRPPVDVAAGERLLAWAPVAGGGWVAGTRDALYLPDERLPWEEVQDAEWDSEHARLRVSEVGTWGEQRPRHALVLDEEAVAETGRLLQLVRERVTASVLLSRHVPVDGRRGVRVIARRAPSGRADVHWAYEYDAGVDPDDPFVQTAAEDALAAAKADVGLT